MLSSPVRIGLLSAHMPDKMITDGKLVSLTYSIRDDTGTLLEQTDLPVSYIQGGANELIGGMDRAVAGKRPGDEIDLALTPQTSGFGPHDPNLLFTDDIDNVPPQFRRIGAELQIQNDAGEVRTVYVSHIENGTLTVDANHPFAGKHLTVHVRITDVRDPTAQEVIDDRGDDGPTLH